MLKGKAQYSDAWLFYIYMEILLHWWFYLLKQAAAVLSLPLLSTPLKPAFLLSGFGFRGEFDMLPKWPPIRTGHVLLHRILFSKDYCI